MKYVLDAQAINDVLPAVYKEDELRPYLEGVFIKDVDGNRIYTATNGHFLFQVVTERKPYEEKLDKEYSLFFDKKFDKWVRFVEFEPKTETSGVIDDETVVKIVNSEGRDIYLVIPKKTTPKARDFALFNPDYLKKVQKFLKTSGLWIPQMNNSFSAAVWFSDNKTAVLMPMRVG